ncbi:unnamed protein product [Eruca vesicaria subsp. sativa]|uniref:RecA family profile 1 domain-containing protein n=1 Tax=Eruca vesicaria subsp. sativa TaxID=29727 RepID=A0ABC8K569_ERUVS|nr:unnamed protein product [Eruca vesicaria subsp. sativa]
MDKLKGVSFLSFIWFFSLLLPCIVSESTLVVCVLCLTSFCVFLACLQQKALEAAMNDINGSFGKGSVTRLGSAAGALVETFPSGVLTLDLALGGGLPKGRVVEIYGPESSGKTTLALHAIAEVQKLGGNAMLVDAEHAFDPSYSKALCVDVENLIVCQPDNGEMAFKTCTSAIV